MRRPENAMYAGGASRRSGGEAWYETRGGVWAVKDNAWTINQSIGTDIGGRTDVALTIVPWDSTCGPDCLQQSEALFFIGQWSWPALQQAICRVKVAVAPSTHVVHVDVRTATTTSSEASERPQRTIPCIVCPLLQVCQRRAQNFTSIPRQSRGRPGCPRIHGDVGTELGPQESARLSRPFLEHVAKCSVGL